MKNNKVVTAAVIKRVVTTVCAFALLASTSMAQGKKSTYTPPASQPSYSSNYSSPSHRMVLSPAFGFFGAGQNQVVGSANNATTAAPMFLSGFFGFGADFEFMTKEDVGLGGFFRYYSTSDSMPTGSGTNTQEYKHSLTTFGGLARGYMNLDSWLLNFGAGLGAMMPGYTVASTSYSIDMGFGFMMSWGFFYKLSPTFDLGVENMRILGLGEKLNGWILSDYMFKTRIEL